MNTTPHYHDDSDIPMKDENDFEIETFDITAQHPPNFCQDQQIDFSVSVPRPKCGEVLISLTGKFTFVCALCSTEFFEMQHFGEHIQSQHMDDVQKGIEELESIAAACSQRTMPDHSANVYTPYSFRRARRYPPDLSENQNKIDPKKSDEVDVGRTLKNIYQHTSQLLRNQNTILRHLVQQNKHIVDANVTADPLSINENTTTTITTTTTTTSTTRPTPTITEPSPQKEFRTFQLPISTFGELEDVEMKLNDKHVMENLISEMSKMCGTKGTADSTNTCYFLIDCFFTREFLMFASWSGQSRCDNIYKKIPFRNYRNIIHAFNTIVRLAASEFDEEESKHFFTIVLRNAKKRCEIQPGRSRRASRKKVRYNRPSKRKNTSNPNQRHYKIAKNAYGDEESY